MLIPMFQLVIVVAEFIYNTRNPPETLKLLENDLQNAIQQLKVDKAVWDPNFDSIKFKTTMSTMHY
jgi:hypothetical protein